jgi:hypothetical protein
MRHLEELKEKYKDGWWEGYDGYSGDDMCSDIKYLIWYIEESATGKLQQKEIMELPKLLRINRDIRGILK